MNIPRLLSYICCAICIYFALVFIKGIFFQEELVDIQGVLSSTSCEVSYTGNRLAIDVLNADNTVQKFSINGYACSLFEKLDGLTNQTVELRSVEGSPVIKYLKVGTTIFVSESSSYYSGLTGLIIISFFFLGLAMILFNWDAILRKARRNTVVAKYFSPRC